MVLKFLILLWSVFVIISSASAAKNQQGRHPHGVPKRIVSFSDDVPVTIDLSAMEIFRQPEIANRKVVAISVVGVYRKGKSFFLNYCLRYLYGNYRSLNYPSNSLSNKSKWIGLPDDSLVGFSWKFGSDRHTKGIIMWSDIFLHDDVNGDKLAIVLIDTQGLFDRQASKQENLRIFALNSLFPSLLILNINDVIAENLLEVLQVATNYGKLIYDISGTVTDSDKKPFQNLMFLIRDWSYESEFPYGLNGGTNYVKKFLSIDHDDSDEQSETLKEVREHIHNAFENIYGYLMPHPGLNAIRNASYDGRWESLDSVFVEKLKVLIDYMLKPENLKVKRIFGEELTGKTYYNYMKAFCEAFQSPDIPNVQSLFNVTLEQQMRSIIDDCIRQYNNEMTQFENYRIGNFESVFGVGHQKSRISSIKKFLEKKKIGSKANENYFRSILENQIDEIHSVQKNKLFVEHRKYIEQQRQIKYMEDQVAESRRIAAVFQAQMQREEKRKRDEEAERQRILRTTGKWVVWNRFDTISNVVVSEGSYVIRAPHGGGLVPGKYNPSSRDAYVAYGGKEHVKNDGPIETLTHTSWEWSDEKNYNRAIPGGYSAQGATIYICRVRFLFFFNGEYVIGKLTNGSCYVPWNGSETEFKEWIWQTLKYV